MSLIVLTTIHGYEHAGIQNLVRTTAAEGVHLLIIGDAKTPSYPKNLAATVHFLGLEEQYKLPLESPKIFPQNHYGRKNIGYLVASSQGPDWISETDDDNYFYPSFWQQPQGTLELIQPTQSRFLNTFSLMGIDDLWPRGIPLSEIRSSIHWRKVGAGGQSDVVCYQGLTDGDPDVDAIARELFQTKTRFPSRSFLLESTSFAPTNSQMTQWKSKVTLPVMYLPFTVSWRVSDIWRGYIAQRFFSLHGHLVCYRGGVGSQKRNVHDLKIDFAEEVEVHTKTHLLLEVLQDIVILDAKDFIREIYLRLCSIGLVKQPELEYLEAWLKDLETISSRNLNLLAP